MPQHRFRQTGIAARRREKAKHWTLQLMYDNYIYFPLDEESNNNKVVERRKGANFRKIRRKFLFFYFSSAAFESKYLQMRLNCRSLFHHPLFWIKFQFGGEKRCSGKLNRRIFPATGWCEWNFMLFEFAQQIHLFSGAMTLLVMEKWPRSSGVVANTLIRPGGLCSADLSEWN